MIYFNGSHKHMCGIIAGVTVKNDITDTLLTQLKKLEYRGYDSAGIATLLKSTGALHVEHSTNSIEHLAQSKQLLPAQTGIAHTRWATHGSVSLANAHPHIADGRVALVHNGIIENHESLKQSLAHENITWRSETDSEVIVHLINSQLKQGEDIINAIKKTIVRLQGSYALAILDKESSEGVYIVAHESSLILAKSEHSTFVSSDLNAITEYASQACTVPKDTVMRITASTIEAYGEPCDLQWKKITPALATNTQKNLDGPITYHEIKEQKRVLGDLAKRYVGDNDRFNLDAELIGLLKTSHRILMIACGSSYYCAQTGKYWLERMARVPVSVELASEFRYRNPVVESGTLLITLSQSGETLDTISAQRHLKKHYPALKSVSIGNNTLSTLAQESDFFWHTQAGPEIGVATTKVFTAQLFCLACLAGYLAPCKFTANQLAQALQQLPQSVDEVLKQETQIETVAKTLCHDQTMLFCARSENFPIAQEAALKLKELAYIHAQAYAAGELKHGPLALIEPSLTTVFFIGEDLFLEKIKSNISEVLSRQGKVLLIGSQTTLDSVQPKKGITTLSTTQETTCEAATAFTNVICAQLFTYHIAKGKKCAIDKPRNLAKCVTVE